MAKAPLGCLVLHGFTSHINTVDGIVPRLEKNNIPYKLPLLRGHGTTPDALVGVRWQDWSADGEKALNELLEQCDKVIVIALSMGGLVALDLATRLPDKVYGLVTVAPALLLKNRVNRTIAPVLTRIIKRINITVKPEGYIDQDAYRTNANYKWIPSPSFMEFLRFSNTIRNPALLARIKQPILIIASTNDQTIDHRTAQLLYDTVSSEDKRLVWFHKSGHEMMRDGEREQVFDAIEQFVVEYYNKVKSSEAQPA